LLTALALGLALDVDAAAEPVLLSVDFEPHAGATIPRTRMDAPIALACPVRLSDVLERERCSVE